MNRLIRKILKEELQGQEFIDHHYKELDILKEMEEKSRETLNKGIDMAVSILKHDYPFIMGWDYKHEPERFRTSIYLELICDMNLASDFYNSPIKSYYKYVEADVSYPFSPLELSSELSSDEKYELFSEMQDSIVEIYDEIPSEYRHEFSLHSEGRKIPKELFIDGFKFEKQKESVNESESDNSKVSLAKSLIHQLFDEVSFIEQSTYNDRPLLTVYFDSDDTAANIESFFTHEICDTVKDYTSGEILCNPSWGPEWKTNRNNPDILIDAILLEYDDEGNVLNESKKEKNYLQILEELVEDFKDEVGVCNINVSYDDEDDMYSVYIVIGTEEMNEKFFYVPAMQNHISKLRMNVKNTIKQYIPIDNLYVGSYGKPNCGWKPLNESKEKPNKDIITNLINNLILPQYEHIICGIEYKDNEERFDIAGKQAFSYPGVTVTFIGGKGTKMYDKVLDEIWGTIYDYTGISVELYSKYVKNCKEPINEDRIQVQSSEYNSLEKIINLEMREKYGWWKDIKINDINNYSNKDTTLRAEITVDEEWGANQWGEFHPHMEFPGNKGWEDNDFTNEYEQVSLGDITGSKLAYDIREIMADIFTYTLNFETEYMSFRNLMLIFD